MEDGLIRVSSTKVLDMVLRGRKKPMRPFKQIVQSDPFLIFASNWQYFSLESPQSNNVQ